MRPGTSFLLAVPLILIAPATRAATCSCAGVPLLSSLDTSAGEQGELFIHYTTEVHEINDLVRGSENVRDETGRERQSISQVLSGSYALSDRWSVSGLVSYVEHTRKIGSSILGQDQASGISDSVLLLRYTPVFITPFSRNQLSVGVGMRLPTGEDNAGGLITLSEDMQPSVGATGKILWTSYSRALNQAATLQISASANYTSNEENRRDYSFGDQLNLALGFSQNVNTRFGYAAALRYRETKADRRNGFTIPNTGGEWLDLVPSISYAISDNLNVGLSGRVPLKRDLNGALQFTTSYSYSVSVTYGF